MSCTLTDAVEAAIGRPLDQLTTTEAIDIADQLRAVLDAPPPITPTDARLATRLTEATETLEHTAGVA